jgi:hypothetical protein
MMMIGALLAMQADRPSSSSVPAVITDEENGLQTVIIEAGKSGYRPAVLEMKAHRMTKIRFRLTTDDEGMSRLLSPDLNLEARLRRGDNVFLIGNPLPGTYAFHSGDGRHEGMLVFRE